MYNSFFLKRDVVGQISLSTSVLDPLAFAVLDGVLNSAGNTERRGGLLRQTTKVGDSPLKGPQGLPVKPMHPLQFTMSLSFLPSLGLRTLVHVHCPNSEA